MSKAKTNGPKVDIDFTLRRVFRKSSFRPTQREVILAALEGHDIFLQAATSFGKSLCFQLPAVVGNGITIVVSPLLALMHNQVAALKKSGILAESLNSTTCAATKKAILADLHLGHPTLSLLYVTPETCALDYFRARLRTVHLQRELGRIVIDEAHCISQWGHDFRLSFMALKWFREEFSDVPIFCCTATATERVRQDILQTLGLTVETGLKCFGMSTSRPNMHYEVRFKSDEKDHFDDFVAWLKGVHQRRANDPSRVEELREKGERIDAVSGIIYALFRYDCERIAERLCAAGIGAKPFHAGLTNQQKDDHLKGWIANAVGYDVVVATTAFGMGIDKEDVRFVCHWQIPKSFEGYYQEAGRAGRDGKASLCIMYYSREDRDRGYYMIGKGAQTNAAETMGRMKSYQAVVEYCELTDTCRHHYISRYFGDTTRPECDFACDWHKDAKGLKSRWKEGLVSEEWCSTQKETRAFDCAYDEYD